MHTPAEMKLKFEITFTRTDLLLFVAFPLTKFTLFHSRHLFAACNLCFTFGFQLSSLTHVDICSSTQILTTVLWQLSLCSVLQKAAVLPLQTYLVAVFNPLQQWFVQQCRSDDVISCWENSWFSKGLKTTESTDHINCRSLLQVVKRSATNKRFFHHLVCVA